MSISDIPFQIERQPDMVTCGATCLHAIYRYFGLQVDLNRLAKVIPQLKNGGTHGVLLGQHALRHGFQVELITFNLHMFDPSWFREPGVDLLEKLTLQAAVKPRAGFQRASKHYMDFLRLGGKIRMTDLNGELIRGYLRRELPILTGLSSTFLYQESRMVSDLNVPDDLRGTPEGHFVVVCGANPDERTVRVADPYHPNVLGTRPIYDIGMDRLLNAILLGIITYDANLVILHPPEPSS